VAETNSTPPSWWIVGPGNTPPNGGLANLKEAPPWRTFAATPAADRGKDFKIDPKQFDVINAAIWLRRPLLVRGKPGVGKTTLAYAVARQLGLTPVLRWSITSRTALKDGLYSYDAIGRLQESSLLRDQLGEAMTPPPIEAFMKLGPVGAALATSAPGRPRVLLIDELDKSDIDLPNDLLHVFEEGEFTIPELARLTDRDRVVLTEPGDDGSARPVSIEKGVVRCSEFPIVLMTSNDERDFPPAFRRRCLELDIQPPDPDDLAEIVQTHLKLGEDPELRERVNTIVQGFLTARTESENNLATDQLLHAVFLALHNVDVEARLEQGRAAPQDKDALIRRLWRPVQ